MTVACIVRRSCGAAALAALLALAGAAPAAQPSFKGLAGSWSGGGTITLEGGAKEKVRCSGSASGGANTLSQSIRCASTSYRFVISSSLRLEGSSVRGNFSESQYGFDASVFGKATANGFRLSLRGNTVSASGSVSGSPTSQSINLSLAGTKVRRVSINLRKG